MESVASVMDKLIIKLLIQKGDCPHCQKPLYAWKTKNRDGTDRCAPTCMSCGYSDLKRKEDVTTKRLYDQSLKSRALNLFQNGSIVPNESLFKKRMANYRVTDTETQLAKEVAMRYIKAILDGGANHLILNGKSGAGKSHLSMAVCWEVIEQSNYDKKVAFVNYRELLEQLKFSFTDPEARKQIQGNLIKDLKTVDLVVLDDLGAELGGIQAKSATSYNNDVLYSLLEAREERALIINTNLSAREIVEAYGERVLSRIQNNSKGFTHTFRETKDKRTGSF